MTVSSGFFNSVDHDRLYDAEEISSMFDGLILDGVYQGYGNVFNIRPGTLPNTVIVESGRAWFNHTWTLNDGDYAIELPASNIMMPRFDTIMIEVNTQTRKNRITYYEGSPASIPEKVCPDNTTKIFYYPIAYIYRPDGSTQVQTSDIVSNIGGVRCPIVTGLLEVMSSERFLVQMNEEFAEFMTENREDFEEWFAGVRDLVGSDPVLELNNKITELDRKVDRTKYKFDESFKVSSSDNTVSMAAYDPMVTNGYISKKIMSSFTTNVPSTAASGGNTFPCLMNGSSITNAAGNGVLQYAFAESPRSMSYNMTGYRRILNSNYTTTLMELFNINYGTTALQHQYYDRIWSPEFINSQLNQQYYAFWMFNYTTHYLDVALVTNEVATVYTSNKTSALPSQYGTTGNFQFDCYENGNSIVLVAIRDHSPKTANGGLTELPNNPTIYVDYWIFDKASRVITQKTINIETGLNKKFIYDFYIDDAHSDTSSVKLCFYMLNTATTINLSNTNYGANSTAFFQKYNLNYVSNAVTQEQSVSLGSPYVPMTLYPPVKFMRRKIASNEYYSIGCVQGNTLSIITLNRANKGNATPHVVTKNIPIINIDMNHDITSGYYSLIQDVDELGFYCLEDGCLFYVSIQDTYAYVSRYKYKACDLSYTNLIIPFGDIGSILGGLVTKSSNNNYISVNIMTSSFRFPYNIQCPFTDKLHLAINTERTWGISI